MNLLNPEEVKKDITERTEESLRRSAAAAIEESRIMARLNVARTQEQAKREKYQQETEEIIKKLSQIKANLEQEVLTLEERRREALRPINIIKENLDKALAELEKE